MIEVRREDDDELCGYVVARNGDWHALTLFHGLLGAHATEADARRDVGERGLASLAQRWRLVDHVVSTDEVVCIQEAWPGRVTLVLAPYAYPDAPTRVLTADQLDAGNVELRPA